MTLLMRIVCFFVGHGGPKYRVVMYDGRKGWGCGLCDGFVEDKERTP